MLRIPIARLPMGLVPLWRQWRSCRPVSPRPFVEHPTCFRVNRAVVFFDALEWLSFSLSYLLTARNGSTFFLGLCQVLVVQSFAFSFRLSKVRSLIVVAEVLLQLAWESNASNFELFQLLLRRRCAFPRRFCRTSVCLFLSTRWHTWQRVSVRFAGVPSWKYCCVVSVFFLTCLFEHLFRLCSTFFVFQKVRAWHPRLLFVLITCRGDWGDVTIVLRRTLLVSAKISYFFHSCNKLWPISQQGIAVRTLLFGRIFAKFEDLGVVHVGDQILRFSAELDDLLCLAQVLKEGFLILEVLELLDQLLDFVLTCCILLFELSEECTARIFCCQRRCSRFLRNSSIRLVGPKTILRLGVEDLVHHISSSILVRHVALSELSEPSGGAHPVSSYIPLSQCKLQVSVLWRTTACDRRLVKIASPSLEQASNCTKIQTVFWKTFPSILARRDPWFRQSRVEFLPYLIHHPSDSLLWRIRLVFLCLEAFPSWSQSTSFYGFLFTRVPDVVDVLGKSFR